MFLSWQDADNPILRAEFRYQRTVIRNGRVGWLWIALAAALVVPTLLLSLIWSGAAVLAGLMPQAEGLLPSIEQVASNGLTEFAVVMVFVMATAQYIVVTLVTLGLSAESIRREKHGRTWDALRLTQISAWQIVRGKWGASLRALVGDHIMVMVGRMGVIVVIVTLIAPAIDMAHGLSPDRHLGLVPLLLVLTVVYGWLDAALTAALGVLAALPDAALGAVVGSVVVGFRLVLMVLAAGWLLLSLDTAINEGTGLMLAFSVIGISLYVVMIIAVLLLAERWVN